MIIKPQNTPWTKEKFVEKAKKIHGDKYLYIGEYINSKTKIEIQCSICRDIYFQKPQSHLEGHGCKKCAYLNNPINQVRITIKDFEDKCKKIHENKYVYFQDFKGTNHKITIYCPKHDCTFNQFAYAHSDKKHSCPLCKRISKGEDSIIKLFKEWNFDFIKEKTFPNLIGEKGRLLRFDFYLECLNLIIEFDGPQHYKSIKWFGGDKYFKKIQENDKIKNQYCKDNNIEILRIKYNEDIFTQINYLFH